MKRFRVLNIDFDMRANVLNLEISPSWEPRIQQHHREAQAQLRQNLLLQYGNIGGDTNLKNFAELGPAPFSVVAFHNLFFRQARNAFVVGAYYPALTGVAALGERVLNHLVRALREDFRSTPEYGHVYSKKSFANWDLAIDTLESWGVLLPSVAILYVHLERKGVDVVEDGSGCGTSSSDRTCPGRTRVEVRYDERKLFGFNHRTSCGCSNEYAYAR